VVSCKKHDILQTRYSVTIDHRTWEWEWRADTNDYVHRQSSVSTIVVVVEGSEGVNDLSTASCDTTSSDKVGCYIHEQLKDRFDHKRLRLYEDADDAIRRIDN
jgi:hypothetical protein